MALTTSFHWGSPADQDWRDPARFVAACNRARATGFESVEVTVTRSVADALALAAAAAAALPDLRFRLTCPALASLVGQVETEELTAVLAALKGRLILHLRMNEGADALDGSATEAGLVAASFRRLLPGPADLDLDVEGQTAETAFFAIKHANRLWRQPDRSTMVDGDASPVLHFGTQVGLVASLIARQTRSDALDAASARLPEADLDGDSASWRAPCVWAGGGDAGGERNVVLIGSFDEVARAIHRYARGGISSLLIRGCGDPETDEREMAFFSAGVLPLVRRLE